LACLWHLIWGGRWGKCQKFCFSQNILSTAVLG
jgi:hypothetical protein